MTKEIAWIVGSGLLTIAIIALTVGLNNTTICQIQLHDTYFVFNPVFIFFPAFLTVASLVYLFRCILNGFSQMIPNGLLIIFSFFCVLLFGQVLRYSQDTFSGGWTLYPPLDANQPSYYHESARTELLIGYGILLTYLLVFWSFILVATLIKTVLLYRSRKQSLKSR
jgi:hypothetical protein